MKWFLPLTQNAKPGRPLFRRGKSPVSTSFRTKASTCLKSMKEGAEVVGRVQATALGLLLVTARVSSTHKASIQKFLGFGLEMLPDASLKSFEQVRNRVATVLGGVAHLMVI